ALSHQPGTARIEEERYVVERVPPRVGRWWPGADRREVGAALALRQSSRGRTVAPRIDPRRNRVAHVPVRRPKHLVDELAGAIRFVQQTIWIASSAHHVHVGVEL